MKQKPQTFLSIETFIKYSTNSFNNSCRSNSKRELLTKIISLLFNFLLFIIYPLLLLFFWQNNKYIYLNNKTGFVVIYNAHEI